MDDCESNSLRLSRWGKGGGDAGAVYSAESRQRANLFAADSDRKLRILTGLDWRAGRGRVLKTQCKNNS